MKRLFFRSAMLLAGIGMVFMAGQAAASDWKPDRTVTWYCTSSPGGGSSIFTQTIIEIIKELGLVEEDIIINYKTDGGGAVGRREVSRKNSGGHTLLTFNNGDLQPLVQVESGDLDMFTPLAVMATDGQILLVPEDSRFKTGKDLIDALNNGERVIINGSKGDDLNLYKRIESEVGGDLEYLMNDSTGDALTQILGRNADAVIAKPAASYELVSAKELRPLIAATRDGFGAPFEAPTFKELGFDIELTVYRGIVGPKDMPEEAAAFWSDVFAQVAKSEKWQEGYLKRFLLTDNHLPYDEAIGYMQDFEDIYTSAK